MRDHPVRVLTAGLLLLALLAAWPGARAESEAVRIELAAEQSLRAGSHAAIEVIVRLPPGSDAPLLVTPSVEGNAVEVVRGRLSRPDAKVVPPHGLRFEVPVRARSEGTAILRIEVMTYVCVRTCQRVVLHASQVLRVQSN